MRYGERMLRKIAEKPGVLVANFHDLDKEEVCKNIFEHCLQRDFDREHWLNLRNQNIQVDFKAVLNYYLKNRPAIDNFKKVCKDELRRLAKAGLIKSQPEVKRRLYG